MSCEIRLVGGYRHRRDDDDCDGNSNWDDAHTAAMVRNLEYEARNMKILQGKANRTDIHHNPLKLTVSGTKFVWTPKLANAWIQMLEERHRHRHQNQRARQQQQHLQRQNLIKLRLNGMETNIYLQRWFERATCDLDLVGHIQTNDLEHLGLIGSTASSHKPCPSLQTFTFKGVIDKDDIFGDNDDNDSINPFLRKYQDSIRSFCYGLMSDNCCLSELTLDLMCFGIERSVRKYLAEPLAKALKQNRSIRKLTLHGGWDTTSLGILLSSLIPPPPPSSPEPLVMDNQDESANRPTTGNKISCLVLDGICIRSMLESEFLKGVWGEVSETAPVLTELQLVSCFEEYGGDLNCGRKLSTWFENQHQRPANFIKTLRIQDMNLKTVGIQRILPTLKDAVPNLEVLDLSNNDVISLEFVSSLDSSSLPSRLREFLLHDNPCMVTMKNSNIGGMSKKNGRRGGSAAVTTSSRQSRRRRQEMSSSHTRIPKQQQYENTKYLKQLLKIQPSIQQAFPIRQDNFILQPIFCQQDGLHRGCLDYMRVLPSIWPYYFELANTLYAFCDGREENIPIGGNSTGAAGDDGNTERLAGTRREASIDRATSIFCFLQIASKCGVTFANQNLASENGTTISRQHHHQQQQANVNVTQHRSRKKRSFLRKFMCWSSSTES